MREIQAFLLEIYAVDVPPDLISTVTDAVVAEVTAWQTRPLEALYPVVFFDALRVKIRDEGTVRRKAVYLALGVLADGTRDILGVWIEQPRAISRRLNMRFLSSSVLIALVMCCVATLSAQGGKPRQMSVVPNRSIAERLLPDDTEVEVVRRGGNVTVYTHQRIGVFVVANSHQPKLNAEFPPQQIGLVPNTGTPYKFWLADTEKANPTPSELWREGQVDGVKFGDQKEGVRKAFEIWHQTSVERNLGYFFEEAESIGEADIIVRKVDLTLDEYGKNAPSVAGMYRSVTSLPNRRVTRGNIFLSINEEYLLTETGYLKVTLHEIGHMLGMAHPWAPSQSKPDDFPLNKGQTVMNNFGYNKPSSSGVSQIVVKYDDPGNNIPPKPTKCDVIGVGLAKTK